MKEKRNSKHSFPQLKTAKRVFRKLLLPLLDLVAIAVAISHIILRFVFTYYAHTHFLIRK